MARTGTPFGGLAGEMLSRTTSIAAIVTGVVFLVAAGTLVKPGQVFFGREHTRGGE